MGVTARAGRHACCHSNRSGHIRPSAQLAAALSGRNVLSVYGTVDRSLGINSWVAKAGGWGKRPPQSINQRGRPPDMIFQQLFS